MATKAEQARVESERTNARSHAAKRQGKHRKLAARKKNPKPHESKHAGRKATYALETHAEGGRPSRKSTRKGANRLKADAAFNVREEVGEAAAKFRHDEARVRGKKVRGRS